MYRFKATITVRQGRVASPQAEQALREFAKYLTDVLTPLYIRCDQKPSYYHPDEESEMRDIDYMELILQLHRDCKRVQSVVFLSQIVHALSSLYDNTGQTRVLCSLEDVQIVPHGDD